MKRGMRASIALALVLAGALHAAPAPGGAGPVPTEDEIVARYFQPAEVERGHAVGNRRTACFAVEQALLIAALGWLAFGAGGRRAAERARAPFERRPRLGLMLEAMLAGATIAVATLPVQFYRGHVMEHELGLSTQSAAGWARDWALAQAIGLALLLGAVLIVHALQRWWPRRWWLASWAGLTAGIVVFFYLHPLLVAPLFNDYRPLPAGELREGCTRIAREAGIPVTEVFVMDASRRTRRFNAYFQGVGATRSIALHDTMVDGVSVRETLAVVGHEAAHWTCQHLIKGMAIASILILLALALLSRPALGGLALDRPGTLARALFAISLFQVLMLPVESGLSRAMEAEADAVGLTFTRDPQAMTTMFVALARSNVSNLTPDPLVRACLYTHPPIPERIRMALAFEARAPAR
jgi:STE24 endopeptidase